MPDATSRDYRGQSRTTPIPACVISADELRRLYGELDKMSRQATERHIEAHKDEKPADMSDDQWKEVTLAVRSRGVLTTMVIGLDGEQLITESGTCQKFCV